ncbi:hypothetical protein VTK73DRAFT_4798 [Phialemonium thermophilum]|uniref:Uncharacterized protein n=1 Tax=Phialemonium thermophilum TaxID=223376 RepID=A0ABR3XYM9_9PEZI
MTPQSSAADRGSKADQQQKPLSHTVRKGQERLYRNKNYRSGSQPGSRNESAVQETMRSAWELIFGQPNARRNL